MGILGTNDGFADGKEFAELSTVVITTPATSLVVILVVACFLQR